MIDGSVDLLMRKIGRKYKWNDFISIYESYFIFWLSVLDGF